MSMTIIQRQDNFIFCCKCPMLSNSVGHFLCIGEGFPWVGENTYFHKVKSPQGNLHKSGITVQMASFVYMILFYKDKVFAKDVKVLYNM